MPEYKRQHFLPATYLKFFSTDQNRCNRESKIWRCDGMIARCVSVISQCFGDYFYSRENAAEVEANFQISERLYCRCVDKIKANKPLTENEYGSLLIVMIDLHLRNAIHENQTGKEQIEAYRLRSRLFTQQILLGRTDDLITKRDVIAHVEKYWSLRILTVQSGNQIFTSDNPSVWHTFRKNKPGVHLITLPLTPFHIAVAFDRRVLQIEDGILTAEDQQTLNAGQIENASKAVYASIEFSADNVAMLGELFKQKSKAGCSVNEKTWSLSIKIVPPEFKFSFVHLNPPLM